MQILIADSGSTKTDWAIIENGELVASYQTIGFNPYFQTEQFIANEIKQELLPKLAGKFTIQAIHYYGTGCSTPEKVAVIEHSLSMAFHNVYAEVNHDLLGAARALCGRDSGIACILGTGSNSCLYDGDQVIENIPSLGYFFGDHGSGAHLGKTLLHTYFDGGMPAHILELFESKGYHREVILDNIYKKPMPSRYMASLSRFILEHAEEPFLQNLVKQCFREFFEKQVLHYTNAHNYPVNSVGSIGVSFRPFLEEVAKEKGFRLGKIIKSPMEGLIEYYSKAVV